MDSISRWGNISGKGSERLHGGSLGDKLLFSELKEGWTWRELSPLNSSLKQGEGAIVEGRSEPLRCYMTFKVLFSVPGSQCNSLPS